jgi:hypothetical protein
MQLFGHFFRAVCLHLHDDALPARGNPTGKGPGNALTSVSKSDPSASKGRHIARRCEMTVDWIRACFRPSLVDGSPTFRGEHTVLIFGVKYDGTVLFRKVRN